MIWDKMLWAAANEISHRSYHIYLLIRLTFTEAFPRLFSISLKYFSKWVYKTRIISSESVCLKLNTLKLCYSTLLPLPLPLASSTWDPWETQNRGLRICILIRSLDDSHAQWSLGSTVSENNAFYFSSKYVISL